MRTSANDLLPSAFGCPLRHILNAIVRLVQPWIVGLLSFHLSVATLAFLTRKLPNAQIAIFLWICGMVYLAQYLNPLAAKHWEELGFTQNYFDSRGVFISAMYSAPLLAVALFQMVSTKSNPSVVV